MRVITWNLGWWQHQRLITRTWQHVRDEFKADLVLLQEAPPQSPFPSGASVFQADRQGWGTAVVARSGTLRALPLPLQIEGFPGRVAAAEWTTEGGCVVVVVSVHAPIVAGYVFPTLETIFRAIEATFAGRSMIVGGDLNTARAAELEWPRHGHGDFWARIDAGRFVDCRRKFHATERLTHTPSRGRAMQLDHLFVTPDLLDRVHSCDVVDDATTRGLSDHRPLVAEIDLA